MAAAPRARRGRLRVERIVGEHFVDDERGVTAGAAIRQL